MAEAPLPPKHRVQFALTGYAAWALVGYSERQGWKGRNKPVEWIVERWLAANQALLQGYGLGEDDYAAHLRERR